MLIAVDAGRGLHVLVVIGHTFTPDSWLAHTRTLYYERPKTGLIYNCSTTWIERFVVQDDNLGPYTLTPSDFIQYFACKLVIVPLPRRLYMTADEAELFAADLLNPEGQDICHTLIGKQIQKHRDSGGTQHDDTMFWYEQLVKHVRRNDLVLRTSLRKPSEWVAGMQACEAYRELKDILDGLTWPEHVWVVEISWPEIFTHARRFCGEVVLDPTCILSDTSPSLDQAWLWIHLPGVILRRNGKTGEIGASVLGTRDAIREHHLTTGEGKA